MEEEGNLLIERVEDMVEGETLLIEVVEDMEGEPLKEKEVGQELLIERGEDMEQGLL